MFRWIQKPVNNVNLYVTTENLSPLKTAIRYNSLENIIEIEPLEPYAQDETYILNITTNVTSLSGKALREPTAVTFQNIMETEPVRSMED